MFSKADMSKKNQFLDQAKAKRAERMQEKQREDAATTINVSRLFSHNL